MSSAYSSGIPTKADALFETADMTSSDFLLKKQPYEVR